MCDGLRSLRQSLAVYAGTFDAQRLNADQAGEVVGLCAQIEASAASIKALAAARSAETKGYERGGYRSACEQLADQAGMSPAAAKRTLDTGRRLVDQPDVAAAALAGELSLEQAAAVSDGVAANPSKAQELIDRAKTSSLPELNEEIAKIKAASTDPAQRWRTVHSKRSFRRWTDREGAFHAHLYGHPEDAARLWRMLDPVRRRLNSLRRQSGAANDTLDALDYDAVMTIAALAAGQHNELSAADLVDLGLFPTIKPADPPVGEAGLFTADPSPSPTAGEAGLFPTDPSRPSPTAGEAGLFPTDPSPPAGEAGLFTTDPSPPAGEAGLFTTDPSPSPPAGAAGLFPADPSRPSPPAGEAGLFSGVDPAGSLADPPPSPPAGEAGLFSGVDAVGSPSPKPGRGVKKLAGSPIRVMVRVDLDALFRGVALDGELCEIAGYGPIPVSVVEDLLRTDNPFIIGVLTKTEALVGVYHHGRRPNAHQRSALDFLHPTCAVQGCSSRAGLQYDHRQDYAKTKITAFDLLDRLCGHHHRKKTNENWALVNGRGKRPFVPPDDPRHPSAQNRDPAGPAPPKEKTTNARQSRPAAPAAVTASTARAS